MEVALLAVLVVATAAAATASAAGTNRSHAIDVILERLRSRNVSGGAGGGDPCSGVEPGLTDLCAAVRVCKFGNDGVNLGADMEAVCRAALSSYGGKGFVAPSPPPTRKMPHQRPSALSTWGLGLLCVTVISVMSVLGVCLLPMMTSWFYKKLLSSLIGLAVGSLTASSLFHLIPGAFSLSEIERFENHLYLNLSLTVWGGVYMFFLVERFLKFVMVAKERSAQRAEVERHRTRENSGLLVNNKEGSNGGERGDGGIVAIRLNTSGEMRGRSGTDETMSVGTQVSILAPPDRHHHHTHSDHAREAMDSSGVSSPIATVAWMIIFGDGVHNFIDGLSIGAAFSESILTGLSVSLAVLCEELPHELGDFAVLLNAGMSMRQAVAYNFLSACTCYVGLIIGIAIGQQHFGNEYIFALAGGMFLYIALVDMTPELIEDIDKVMNSGSFAEAGLTFVLQNVGILVGIFSLFFLAKFDQSFMLDGQAPADAFQSVLGGGNATATDIII